MTTQHNVRRNAAPRRRRPLAIAVVGLALLAAGCGSLQPHEDIVRAAGGGTQSQGGSNVGGTAGTGAVTAPGAGSSDSTTTGSDANAATGQLQPGSTGLPADGGTTTGAGAGTSAGSGTGTSGSAVSQDRAPVLIGNVSTLSGIAGAAQGPGFVGMRARVKYVNAQGGVNGHLIKLIARDDQNDPSQNASYTQALVEQSKVVAFVSNWASQTQHASADYLKSKGIPVVGGDHTSERTWGVNPMFFPVAAIGADAVRITVAGMAKVALPVGKTKLGILACVEAAICTNGARISADYAPKVGFNIVYNGSASFAAPGYTAECLNMKNAGVQALQIIFPEAAVKNVARDCARQGLKAIYALTSGTMEGDFNQDANFEGSSVVGTTFPFAGGTSAVAREYAAALKKYEPNQLSNPAAAAGWAAGKVFGAALAKVQGPVTSQKLLAALYTFKKDSFGGATIPLTFLKGPMTPPRCYYLSVIRAKAYVVQNGGRFVCAP
ncbi:MAG: ABC transporter substrate-binding protein [Mycobacteriales bacterium]